MRGPTFTDEQLLADLAAAAVSLGEPLTATSYDAWQRGRHAASPALLVRRFGSWNEACSRAGVATNKTRSGSRRWSDEDLVASVAEYLATPDATGSFAGYSSWAQGRDGVPSGSLIRQRFTWAELKKRAAAS